MAFRTFKRNFVDQPRGEVRAFDWPVWLDQRAWSIDELLAVHRKELSELREQGVDLIAGGPPCQGFSFAGRRQERDPRNQLFLKYLEMVQLIQPTAVILENVPGMAVAHGAGRNGARRSRGDSSGSFFDRLAKQLDVLGYDVRGRVIDATEYGVPQRRGRLIVVGLLRNRWGAARDAGIAGLVFEQLEGQCKQHLAELGLKAPVSAYQAIGDLTILGESGRVWDLQPCCDPESPDGFFELAYDARRSRSAYQKLMRKDLGAGTMDSMRLARHRPDVQSRFARIIFECRSGVRMNDRDRARFGLRKHRIYPMHRDEPAPTITTLPDDVLHYRDPRILTVREYARLQSFPDWFVFKGKYTTGGDRRTRECPRYTQVGNAVPPLLGLALGRALDVVLTRLDNTRRSDRSSHIARRLEVAVA
jgi:DNA (cytosine-5)-methyltransferase 1